MVGVAGDSVGVEGEQPVRGDLDGNFEDVGGELVHVDLAQRADGVVQQAHGVSAENLCGLGQLDGAEGGEVTLHGAQGGGFPAGEAQRSYACPGVHERGEHGAESDGLVVGVGDDGQDGPPGGQLPRFGELECGHGSVSSPRSRLADRTAAIRACPRPVVAPVGRGG
jgi:hypothetical protein